MLLQELLGELRSELNLQIAENKFSGTDLARRTGITQAHVSNFLRGRRGLSVELFDRILSSLNISILDLLLRKDKGHDAISRLAFSSIPLIPIGKLPAFDPHRNKYSSIFVLKTLLSQIEPNFDPKSSRVRDFVGVITDAKSVEGMAPLIKSNHTLIIDMADKLISPGELHVVRYNNQTLVRFLESNGKIVAIRAVEIDHSLALVPTQEVKILGRVRHISFNC